jgi:hypothetical protein
MPQVTGGNAALGKWALIDVKHAVRTDAPADIVAALRRLQPRYVPLVITRAFVTPTGGVDHRKYDAIGIWSQFPDSADESSYLAEECDRGPNFPFSGGVIYVNDVLMDPHKDKGKRFRNEPEEPLPLDWWVVRAFEYVHHKIMNGTVSPKDRYLAGIRRQWEKRDEELAKVREDARLALHDERRTLAAAIDAGHWFDKPKDVQPYTQATKVWEGDASSPTFVIQGA